MIDRSASSDVATRVSRLVCILAAATLTLGGLGTACGGGSKKSGTTPTGEAKSGDTKSKDAKGLKDLDPDADGNVPTTKRGDGAGGGAELPKQGDGSGAKDGDAVGDAGKDGDPGKDGEVKPPAATEPTIPPPDDRDIDPATAKRRVAGYLKGGTSALRSNNANKAIEQAKLALGIDPQNIDAVVLLGQAYYAKKFYDTAEVLFDLVLKDRPKRVLAERNARFFYVRGLVYDRTERPRKAMKAYKKAVSINPNLASAQLNLGVHYLRNGVFVNAVQTLERVTKTLKLRTAISWNAMGAAYRGMSGSAVNNQSRRNQLLKQAETAFKRARTVNANYAPVYYNLGVLYMDAPKFPLGNGTMAKLKRLEQSKTYLDQYRSMLKANSPQLDTVDRRIKQMKRLIRREKKRLKRMARKKKKSS